MPQFSNSKSPANKTDDYCTVSKASVERLYKIDTVIRPLYESLKKGKRPLAEHERNLLWLMLDEIDTGIRRIKRVHKLSVRSSPAISVSEDQLMNINPLFENLDDNIAHKRLYEKG